MLHLTSAVKIAFIHLKMDRKDVRLHALDATAIKPLSAPREFKLVVD